MLHNNLDPDVAERPDDLVVYGGSGKAARDWASFDAISRTLHDLKDDETLLVQSGKPVGVLRTHEWAPRVLIANATWSANGTTGTSSAASRHLGLTMYGQMTAGSWIYIGTQGILQGTYETFAAIAAKRFGGSLAGTLTFTAGVGGMGGAQPLAVTMNGGVAICADVDRTRLQRRLDTRYLDVVADDIDDAIRLARHAQQERMAQSDRRARPTRSNCSRAFVDRNEAVDVVTDQTPAHDPLPTCPRPDAREADELRRRDPDGYLQRARDTIGRHVTAMLALLDRGVEVFDYGNSLRAEARLAGVARAFDYPGFVPAYIRPLFCEGKGPFRWVALSGDPADIGATDRAVLEEFPDNEPLARWIRMASDRVAFQGLPARICWLGLGERAAWAPAFNDMVASGRLRPPS